MAYSNAAADKLYGLLPSHIREKDAAEGEPLRGLLRIIEKQADAVEGDIRQLQEDAFIETCEPWVIPYIGDLVGTTPLFDDSRARDGDTAADLFPDLDTPNLRPPLVLRGRADVAKTIYYRRRKGTLPMLEELARDVTGWAAHAVEFFELLGWTQWIRNHVRMHARRTPDIRSVERMDRLNRAFDEIQHTVDVRPIAQDEGWHNIRNIGFFLWRLGAYRMEAVEARHLGGFRYYFSPLGNSAPLFSRQRREGDEAGLATELHVPQPIRPARFYEDLKTYGELPAPKPDFTDFYGLFDAIPGFNVAPAPSLVVFVDGNPVPAADVRCRNLSTFSQPDDAEIAVDVARGRLAIGPDLIPASGDPAKVEVYYHYGFPADLGGGPYARRAWLARDGVVFAVDGSGNPGTFDTVTAALAAWIAADRPTAVIRIGDNRTYREALAIDLQPAKGNSLTIEAADRCRPHLRLDSPLVITGDRSDFTLTLGGCLIEGSVDLQGSLHRLRLLHTTLVPGVSIAEPGPPPNLPSVTASGGDANPILRVEIASSIVGPLRIPEHAEGLFVIDSIVDGTGTAAIAGVGAPMARGPALRLERTTVRGATRVRQIDLATEAIFDGLVTADRIQVGCVRFSYVDPKSRTPRRYRCQPDLAGRREIEAVEAASGPLSETDRNAVRARVARRVRPEYTAEAYGQPAYLQLSLRGPAEIATGAEDGSEMGAYCHLKQPQREANLRLRLEEYLPFGLDYGFIYST
ncbi:MAG TPA: hypothetical protein VF601_23550 [Beijerinckiaceae bacterium]|jgi:hypothetical protein